MPLAIEKWADQNVWLKHYAQNHSQSMEHNIRLLLVIEIANLLKIEDIAEELNSLETATNTTVHIGHLHR